MNTSIDLHDIQGNVVKGYGRYGYPKARYIFYRIDDEVAGRQFVQDLLPLITTGVPWSEPTNPQGGSKPPPVTTNIAFTFEGLENIGVPQKSMQSFPDDFAMGMKKRKTFSETTCPARLNAGMKFGKANRSTSGFPLTAKTKKLSISDIKKSPS